MRNFWDLPKPLRKRIYRLRFIQSNPITLTIFLSHCGVTLEAKNLVPVLFKVCPKLEKEASHIYFGENVFSFEDTDGIVALTKCLRPRHTNQIRKAIVTLWRGAHLGTSELCRENFKYVSKLKSLESLILDVNEFDILKRIINRHLVMRRHEGLGYGPQVHLKVLYAPGIRDLRSLRGIKKVEILHSDPGGSFGLESSSIAGGVLEMVRDEIMGTGQGLRSSRYARNGHFRFLDLPAELRTQIYNQLLIIPGPIYPVSGEPSSVDALVKFMPLNKRSTLHCPCSALDILLANRQVYREAVKIFYHDNDFIFSYPVNLQAFIINLENDRLSSLQNITLFYEEKQDERDGASTMEVTFSLLRRLQLRKFHLLLPRRMMMFMGQTARDGQSNFAMLQGAKILFSLRGVEDIKVIDPGLREHYSLQSSYHRLPVAELQRLTKRQHNLLKHFNYGLQLAQNGVVVTELYTDNKWKFAKTWPVLEGSTCGSGTDCRCGENENDN